MDKEAVEAFRKVYSHVDDIDLFSGMMSEKPLEGGCFLNLGEFFGVVGRGRIFLFFCRKRKFF
jgi:hypothetical protein